MSDLAAWREQLAREEMEDSDDEGLGGYGRDDVVLPPDTDLGLALEEVRVFTPLRSAKNAASPSLFARHFFCHANTSFHVYACRCHCRHTH